MVSILHEGFTLFRLLTSLLETKMQIRKLWLAAALLVVYTFPVSAFSKNTTAADELKEKVKNFSVIFPEPAAEEINIAKAAPRSKARADWRSAVKLYHDSIFKPKPQRRVDVTGSSTVMLQGFYWYADSYWYNPP